jgi:hypothetical protein
MFAPKTSDIFFIQSQNAPLTPNTQEIKRNHFIKEHTKSDIFTSKVNPNQLSFSYTDYKIDKKHTETNKFKPSYNDVSAEERKMRQFHNKSLDEVHISHYNKNKEKGKHYFLNRNINCKRKKAYG